jgi:hypothetical protein
MLTKKLLVIFFMICISAAIHAQTSIYYSVSLSSPFAMTKNGNKINSPHAQKTTSEITHFINLDCLLNIYSYAELLGGMNIYKNGVPIKKFPMKEKGLIVLNADSMGNWSGYVKTGNNAASIYTNGKLVKTVKINEVVSEKIVGVEQNGDVISLVTDKVKSQVLLKKNGNVISVKTLPKINGTVKYIRVIGKNEYQNSYQLVLLVRPPSGTKSFCGEGLAQDAECLRNNGCMNADGTIDLKCAQQQINSGHCPCMDPNSATQTVPPNGCSDSGGG